MLLFFFLIRPSKCNRRNSSINAFCRCLCVALCYVVRCVCAVLMIQHSCCVSQKQSQWTHPFAYRLALNDGNAVLVTSILYIPISTMSGWLTFLTLYLSFSLSLSCWFFFLISHYLPLYVSTYNIVYTHTKRRLLTGSFFNASSLSGALTLPLAVVSREFATQPTTFSISVARYILSECSNFSIYLFVSITVRARALLPIRKMVNKRRKMP